MRCGHCKTDFADTDKAVAHVATHEPRTLAATSDKPLFRVRRNVKTGDIEEVLSSPPLVGV